jgi:1-acylglycerone phosphate reductase
VFATARSVKTLGNLSAAGIEVFTLDVTSQESINALKAEITSLADRKLDVLYNNAGVSESLPCVSPPSCLQYSKSNAEFKDD